MYATYDHDDIGKYLEETYEELSELIPEEYRDPQWKHSIKEAHTTIVYGPEDYFTNDYPDISLDELYPRFQEKYKDIKIDDLIYKGISLFIRTNRIVVKAEFESIKLNEIRNHLYNCSESMKENYIKWKTMIEGDDHEISKMDKYKSIYKKDETFADDPKGWIHATLAVLGPNASIDKILEIKEKAEERLSKHLIIGKKYTIKDLRLRTPVSKKTYILW